MTDSGGRAEHPRDQAESDFTPILRRLWAASPGVLAAVFVDGEGECIDYCSSIEPFDAKVNGAHLRVVMAELEGRLRGIAAGEPLRLVIHADTRDLVVRRVDEAHALVAVTEGGGEGMRVVLQAVEDVVVALRQEGRLERPTWDPLAPALRVELRAAVGWPYAPLAFVEQGRRVQVTEVLGRWLEGPPGSPRAVECFRVRTRGGEELTLAHDPSRDAWLRW